jgi:hypothetical protein
VNEDAVAAHGKNLDAQGFELSMFLGDRRDFGGSDKGEVTGIETEEHPFAEVVGQFDGSEFAVEICGSGKIRGFFTNLNHGTLSL